MIVSLVALFGTLGIGLATAKPPYYGMTYAKVSETLAGSGQTAAIATVIGSQLPTDDCIVINAYKSFTLNGSGRNAHNGTWMVSLDCNNPVAQPGKPGNSVSTAEGKKWKSWDTQAELINKNVTKALGDGSVPSCGKSAQAGKNCLALCTKTQLCSAEVLNYLQSLV
ncbi:hypothetical protein [Mycolicibacterium vinylchloridicum]|uniref:hypothetical protein n=1 Tax=Mycolicibacterium vinylchloridicum TaxID=2736928 RepID=UPI0015CD1F54|nr:hypothetical protein [Mycolicibacterium vinylchloridicum]